MNDVFKRHDVKNDGEIWEEVWRRGFKGLEEVVLLDERRGFEDVLPEVKESLVEALSDLIFEKNLVVQRHRSRRR